MTIKTWPARPRAPIPCKTIREKVPYEGRTRWSDRAGKTGTALLETPKAKSIPVNEKNSFVEYSESEIYYPGEVSHAELLQWPTHSGSKERNLTLLANEEASIFLRWQQANRRSGKQFFRINCSIISFWNKQPVLRRNYFPRKASKNSSWVKSKKSEVENKIRYKWFLRVYRVSGRSWLKQKNHKHTKCALG